MRISEMQFKSQQYYVCKNSLAWQTHLKICFTRSFTVIGSYQISVTIFFSFCLVESRQMWLQGLHKSYSTFTKNGCHGHTLKKNRHTSLSMLKINFKTTEISCTSILTQWRWGLHFRHVNPTQISCVSLEGFHASIHRHIWLNTLGTYVKAQSKSFSIKQLCALFKL